MRRINFFPEKKVLRYLGILLLFTTGCMLIVFLCCTPYVQKGYAVIVAQAAGFEENFKKGVLFIEPAFQDFLKHTEKGWTYIMEIRPETQDTFYRPVINPVPMDPANNPQIRFTWKAENIRNKLLPNCKNENDSAQVNAYIDYIDKYKMLAVYEMWLQDVPASIKMAQALHESNAGRSTLALTINAHFGIKCWSSKGEAARVKEDHVYRELACDCFNKKDDDEYDYFNAYCGDTRFAAVMKSYQDHSRFLHKYRYRKLFDAYKVGHTYMLAENKWFGKGPVPYYKAWAYGLKMCGYATSDIYPTHLVREIEKYELHLLDYDVVVAKYKYSKT
ncbi:MAG: flagellum-specific peptidoglycan hydrolase FlgJ [Planctomycetota bacterium]|jgi:flagellum-specific peptidoglycan hydrolase FlgJ